MRLHLFDWPTQQLAKWHRFVVQLKFSQEQPFCRTTLRFGLTEPTILQPLQLERTGLTQINEGAKVDLSKGLKLVKS